MRTRVVFSRCLSCRGPSRRSGKLSINQYVPFRKSVTQVAGAWQINKCPWQTLFDQADILALYESEHGYSFSMTATNRASGDANIWTNPSEHETRARNPLHPPEASEQFCKVARGFHGNAIGNDEPQVNFMPQAFTSWQALSGYPS